MASTEKAKTVMGRLVREFSSRSFPDVVSKAHIDVPEIPSSKWSMGNRILMLIEGTSDARGYRQWGQVGRYPRKGSKAIYILGPSLVRDKDDEDKKILVGFRCIPVFRYEDTDGAELKTYEPERLPPLFGLAEYNGITVQWINSIRGENASISVSRKNMRLCTEDPTTYLHELIHYYDLRDRDRKRGQDKTQEIVAQLGACTLAKMYGIDDSAYTWNYISSYAGTRSPDEIGRECMAVIDRVEAAITAILADARKAAQIPA